MNAMALSDLPGGVLATVVSLVKAFEGVDGLLLQRLGELGFLPNESVCVLRRGPGGREPLAVQVGEVVFALRRVEAQCVRVQAVAQATQGAVT